MNNPRPKPFIPDYAGPATKATLVERTDTPTGICFVIRPPTLRTLLWKLVFALLMYSPVLLLLISVIFFPVLLRWRLARVWQNAFLIAVGLIIMISGLASWFGYNGKPAIFEIREGRLTLRVGSTFTDWPIESILAIRTEWRDVPDRPSILAGSRRQIMDYLPRPHLEIRLKDRDSARLLYQYSTNELREIARIVRDALDKRTMQEELEFQWNRLGKC